MIDRGVALKCMGCESVVSVTSSLPGVFMSLGESCVVQGVWGFEAVLAVSSQGLSQLSCLLWWHSA